MTARRTAGTRRAVVGERSESPIDRRISAEPTALPPLSGEGREARTVLQRVIEKLSDHPGLFLFCRAVLEGNFRTIRRVIREKLPADPKRRILDVACGPGAFSELFLPETYSGVDINERYIGYANRHYHGTFQTMDARRLHFEDASFDDALVFGLLHHLNDEDARAVLAQLHRILKPGGRALIIEDIPTESKLNLIGHLLHRVENGRHIRSAQHYRSLLPPRLRPAEETIFRSGICDYYMARVVVDAVSPGHGGTPSSRP